MRHFLLCNAAPMCRLRVLIKLEAMIHQRGRPEVSTLIAGHIFFKFHQSCEYNMPVGIFQKVESWEMGMQYFSDQRPDYYCFSNKTKEMTGAEIMLQFAKDI